MDKLLQYHPLELGIALILLALLIVLTCLILSRLFDRSLISDVQEIEEGNREALATFEEHASDLYDLKDSLELVVEETAASEAKGGEGDEPSETNHGDSKEVADTKK